MDELYGSLSPAQRAAFLEGPALAPPAGVLPNFEMPNNGNALCLGVTIPTTVIAALVVFLRLYSKISCAKKLRVEDAIMVAALGLYAGFIYIAWTLYNFPGGFVHQWNVRVRETPRLLHYINTAVIIYGVAMLLLKTAILLDWIHIFAPSPGLRTRFYRASVGIMTINILFYIGCILAEIFACSPREKLWNVLLPGRCDVNTYAINVVSSVFNFVIDLVMLALPQGLIWRLQLSLKKKIALSLLFVLGVLGCVCGALRIVYSISFMRSADKSYTVSSFALAGIGEMTSGFLVVAIPAFPKLVKNSPFLRRILDKMQYPFSSEKDAPNSRQGLPSWIRAKGQARGRLETGDEYAGRGVQDAECADSAYGMSRNATQNKVLGAREEKQTGSPSDGSGVDFITAQQV
ncbi:hypothetical protein EJ04DRAFT_570519 [Polyplosphaeria fusca]|uniref:Rhodopsin domain-containing protein n=1 Tax=Polyplosphaeria fusca TaxID=682080 RepID=A0A9P4QLW8_9PLEO|nr:hypothetical protein EJ04DRAFT_570519 [Polyplosphaeria fusca]